jgi:hypothetical protein
MCREDLDRPRGECIARILAVAKYGHSRSAGVTVVLVLVPDADRRIGFMDLGEQIANPLVARGHHAHALPVRDDRIARDRRFPRARLSTVYGIVNQSVAPQRR